MSANIHKQYCGELLLNVIALQMVEFAVKLQHLRQVLGIKETFCIGLHQPFENLNLGFILV